MQGRSQTFAPVYQSRGGIVPEIRDVVGDFNSLASVLFSRFLMVKMVFASLSASSMVLL